MDTFVGGNLLRQSRKINLKATESSRTRPRTKGTLIRYYKTRASVVGSTPEQSMYVYIGEHVCNVQDVSLHMHNISIYRNEYILTAR